MNVQKHTCERGGGGMTSTLRGGMSRHCISQVRHQPDNTEELWLGPSYQVKERQRHRNVVCISGIRHWKIQ